MVLTHRSRRIDPQDTPPVLRDFRFATGVFFCDFRQRMNAAVDFDYQFRLYDGEISHTSSNRVLTARRKSLLTEIAQRCPGDLLRRVGASAKTASATYVSAWFHQFTLPPSPLPLSRQRERGGIVLSFLRRRQFFERRFDQRFDTRRIHAFRGASDGLARFHAVIAEIGERRDCVGFGR